MDQVSIICGINNFLSAVTITLTLNHLDSEICKTLTFRPDFSSLTKHSKLSVEN